ncbi:MAG: transposase [Microcoleus sp. PH2017_10_PVI_O_A]|uniref:transposase n=1 Tax=unclassified Microcoleus TaxID=2642155 RepID=UPI001D9A3EA4|nr:MULTISPECIES: transposase [unclassified Microcoleus]MCC3410131.1 transposase [Microcoleus sp. PH2017_10_PVI_O_A]MCC3464401.1 transposase [Microcoleus sp. PH2017_11_PCY_U_A]MCC3482731.1 transposase [Microcoleus sp. PH2017_12_PCY_D_A]MCC3532554.1 transposase [Microcoleus sp. PH2017_21_RUC_O_A]MCC3544820.1 transposase [Microcoleus sp. PH2017_22_RUC_O_B]
MTIAQREQQIHRVKATSFQPELDAALEQTLRTAVLCAVKVTLESALQEEVKVELSRMEGEKPRRSGYFERGLDTQYGHVSNLRVPKLRGRNSEREWQILQRYQRGLGNLVNWLCCLYVMVLSLRDLQEALYFLVGHVLSRSAVNQVTLQIQQRLDGLLEAPIVQTPEILIVDGVWVEIQYTREEFKVDRAGHLRQSRQAEERVILAVLGVWDDGSYAILHYEIATAEGEAEWSALFEHLIERGLVAPAVKLVVSDGSLGLPKALQKTLPQARQQRCITHKVRGIERYLSYAELSSTDERGQPLKSEDAKRQRRFEIESDAYAIYDTETPEQARQQLRRFIACWEPLEPKAEVFQPTFRRCGSDFFISCENLEAKRFWG